MKNIDFCYSEIIKSRIDGPGKRDFILLKDCPLDCAYCINKLYLKESIRLHISSEKLISLIEKDYKMFEKYKSGISFGGGESLLQYQQLIEFDKLFPKEFTIFIETSINIDSEKFKYFLDNIDLNRFLFLIDIKDLNNEIYKKYTGISNENVLKNLNILKEYNLQEKCQIRVPIIEKYNKLKDRRQSVKYLKDLGFKNIEIFKYDVIKYKKEV